MRSLLRSLGVALAVTVLLGAIVSAATPFTTIPVSITVDSDAPRTLVADPPSITIGDEATAEGIRPGDQAGQEFVITNTGTVTCKDVLITNHPPNRYILLESWPTGPLAPTKAITVKVIISLTTDAPNGTTQTMEIGTVCMKGKP